MPDSIEDAYDDQRLIMAVEAAAFHEPMYRQQAEDYQPKLRAMLADGLQVDGIVYARALERRRRFIDDMEQLSQHCDVMLTPATPAPSQADRTNTGDPAFQGPWTSCGLPAIALPSGSGRIRFAPGDTAGGLALRRGTAAVRVGVVRGGAGGNADAAAIGITMPRADVRHRAVRERQALAICVHRLDDTIKAKVVLRQRGMLWKS